MDPKNKYVLNLAGIVQYSLGRYQEAQETFEFLIAEDPGFVSAYLNLGNVLWESGNEDAALVTWKQALAALMLLWLLLLLNGCGGDLKGARESYRVGDYPRALRLYEAELDRHPASFAARFGYAVVLQELSLRKKALGDDEEKDWTEVVRAYEVCARLGDSAAIAGNYAISLFHLANKLYLRER